MPTVEIGHRVLADRFEHRTRPNVRFSHSVIAFLNIGVVGHGRTIGDPAQAAMACMALALSGTARSATAGSPLDPDETERRIAFAVRLFLDGARVRWS